MLSAKPLRYSSTALSMISQRRWCSPLLSTPPMYIDGRLRTGSSPSRAVISAAVYLDVASVLMVNSIKDLGEFVGELAADHGHPFFIGDILIRDAAPLIESTQR